MKISINWLRDFIDLARLPQQGQAEELDVLLTNTGLEVEGVEAHEKIPGGLRGFVVGEVLTCEKFEVKEKTLSLTTVDAGLDEILTIVCGAANVAAGQKVIIGLYHRLKESFYPYIGIQSNDLKFGVSYDVITGPAKTSFNSVQSVEATLSLTFGGKKKK